MGFRKVAIFAAMALAMPAAAAAPVLPPSPEAYIADENAGLDAMQASIAGMKETKPLFAAVLHLAHGGIFEKMPLEVLDAYADALKEAGAERIDIYTTQSAWPDKVPETIAKYDALIAHIRQIGMKLGFDPEVDTRTLKGAGFEVWRPWAIAAYTEMARRYQPEKFSVMHETTSMKMALKENVTPGQWASFAADACDSIAKVSPKTICTVAVLPFERADFDALIKVPELKSIGLDIFGQGDDIVNYDSQGLKKQLVQLDGMISAARAAGKSMHLAETGRQTWGFMGLTSKAGPDAPTPYAAYDIGDPRYEPLDERWFTTMVHYAAAHHFDGVTLFRTTTFFTYSLPGTNPSLVSTDYIMAVAKAASEHKRTGMFDAYRRIVDSFKP